MRSLFTFISLLAVLAVLGMLSRQALQAPRLPGAPAATAASTPLPGGATVNAAQMKAMQQQIERDMAQAASERGRLADAEVR